MVLCVTSPLPKTPLWDLCVATRRIDPDLSRFDWEKLKVAVGPGELDSNTYVGDLDRELFREVFGLFHKVFHDPAYIESREMRLQALARLRTLADLSPSTKVA
jgi:hypothetical protein